MADTSDEEEVEENVVQVQADGYPAIIILDVKINIWPYFRAGYPVLAGY